MRKQMMSRGLKVGTIGVLCMTLGFSWALAEEPPAPAAQTAPAVLTLAEAIELALGHHPSLLAARGAAASREASMGEARAPLLPQLSVSSSYTQQTNNSFPRPQFGGSGLSTPEPSHRSTGNYSNSLSLQQLIFDFGKTGNELRAARESLDASRFDVDTSRLNIVLNVKVAYYGLLEARHLVEVNEETVKQFQEHLDQVQGFYQAGTRTRYDVTTAEVNLTNARLDLIKAKNAVRVAEVTLANAMGVPDQAIGAMEELLEFQKMDVQEEQALNEAMTHRPDLQSVEAERRSAEASVRSAQRGYFPVLSGSADYTYRGQNFPLVWNWDVGASLSVPIFSGLLTQSQVARARADAMVADANAETLRQTVLLEVRQSYSNLVEAEERVKTAEVVVKQAQENLDLANGRFQAGVGTSVEQTDAQVQLANAKTARLQALFDYRVAAATIEKAMGRSVP
jgi:outer membrane protein